MKTSARNEFTGKVMAVRTGAVNDEIDIQIASGPRVVAIVTSTSTKALGLREGISATALIKSSSVLVATDLQGMKLSARNQFAGTVTSVQPGAVNSEVTLDVGGGTSITAIVTQASADALGLKTGARATAFFKASSVIVAVQA